MWQELRVGLRPLLRDPLFSLAVLLTLAVGTGAVTSAFTLVHGVLSPLGYPQAGSLVRIYETLGGLKDSPNPRLKALWNQAPASYLDAADWRRGSRTLGGIGLYLGSTAVLEAGGGGEPLEVSAARIDAQLLRVLGVPPALGRSFNPQEVSRRERLAILAHDLWADVFGADRKILGRALRLDGRPYTVVGVMPRGFALAGRRDSLWIPAGPTGDDLAIRDEHAYAAVGRLAPGATLAAAQAELDRIASDLAAAHRATNAGTGVRLVPLLDTVVGDSRHLLLLLFAAAAAVLMVACVNLAHLFLARAVERRAEMALRFALGARRRHLLRQRALEILALAAGGGAGGLLLASFLRRALPTFLAPELPRLENVAVDGRVVLFALAAGLAASLLGGLLPAVLGPAAAPREALAERRGVRLLQEALVVAEVALTLALTAGALALVTGWQRLAAVDPGFDARGVLVQEVRLPAWRYPDEVRRGELAARLLQRLAALPGATGAALTSRLPLPGSAEVWGFRLGGEAPPGGDWTRGRSAVMQFATSGYFRLLRIPLVAGRTFDALPGLGLRREPARAVMVSRALAERHWPGSSAVDAVVAMHGSDYRVVGVFGDIRQQGLADEPGELMIQPWSQGPAARFAALVRAGRRPLDSAPAVRRALRELDPDLPLPAAARLDEIVARSVAGPRSRALLVALSACVALALALIGTYGVMAYSIGRRRREIAIRMAAGADRGWVLRWVLRRTLALALAGVGLGVLCALAASRLLAGLAYGVSAADASGLIAAALLLIATCLAAGYFPARQASRTEPASALRSE
jgi:putative ABC transport system permease protein